MRLARRGIAVIAFALAACGGGGGAGSGDTGGSGNSPPVVAADYFPLSVGDRWVYRYDDGSRERQEVTGTRTVDGQAAVVVTTTELAFGRVEEALYRKSIGAVTELTDPTDPLSVAIGPLDLQRLPLRVGDSYVQVDKVINDVVDVDADGRADPLALRLVVSVVESGALSVAAGNFADTVHLRYALNQSATGSTSGALVQQTLVLDAWYAAGVGLIKTRTSTGAGATSQVSTSELEAYRVGGVQSDSRPPQLVSGSPGNGATVGTTVVVSLEFDEMLDASAASATVLTLVDASGREVARGLTAITGGRVRSNMPLGLAAGVYTVRTDGTLRDPIGNPVSLSNLSFTIDAAGPVLRSTVPAANATGVSLTAPLQLVFDEAVDLSSVARSAWLRPQNQPLSSIALKVTLLDSRTVQLQPQVPLSADTAYFIDIQSGVGDLYGNGSTFYRIPFTTGQALLQAPRKVVASFGNSMVAVGDVTGDGRADFVTLDAAETALLVHPQLNDGSMGAAIAVPLAGACAGGRDAVVIADVNGDGRNDVLVNVRGCGVEVLYQDASARLASGASLLSDQSLVVRVADIDGDGRLDVVSVGYEGSKVSVWLQRADGTMGSEIAIPWRHSGVVDMAVGDIDGDGRPDIVLAARGQGAEFGMLVARQLAAAGTYEVAQRFEVDPVYGASAVAIADLNHDGRLDIVAGSSVLSDSLHLFLQGVDGRLQARQSLPGFGRPTEIVAGDLNADGRTDLVVRQAGLVPLVVVLQAADGGLVRSQQIDNELWGTRTLYVVALGDLNGDARVDIALGDGRVMFAQTAAAAAQRARPDSGSWAKRLARGAGLR